MKSSTSLNEIAYSILNDLRGGRSSNTENISLDQIKFAVNYYRATFIRRDQHRHNFRSSIFEQDLGHLDTKIVDTAEDNSITAGNTVTRTVKQIPEPVRLANSEAITFIGGPDKAGKPIPLLSDVRTYWNQFSKYTGNEAYATYRGGYIYLFNDVSIDTVNVRGVFVDPEEVYNFTKANDFEVYNDDEPYPLPADMIEGIKKGMLNGELKLAVQSLNDDETDLSQDEQ